MIRGMMNVLAVVVILLALILTPAAVVLLMYYGVTGDLVLFNTLARLTAIWSSIVIVLAVLVAMLM